MARLGEQSGSVDPTFTVGLHAHQHKHGLRSSQRPRRPPPSPTRGGNVSALRLTQVVIGVALGGHHCCNDQCRNGGGSRQNALACVWRLRPEP